MKIKESKICLTCGKSFTNRKKWSKRGVWNQVKYCSERCRRERKSLDSKR